MQARSISGLHIVGNREDVMLVYLRETFGGSPSPSEWGALAEPM